MKAFRPVFREYRIFRGCGGELVVSLGRWWEVVAIIGGVGSEGVCGVCSWFLVVSVDVWERGLGVGSVSASAQTVEMVAPPGMGSELSERSMGNFGA
jgi:hypothetical protein